jgi:hypothetical protein
MAAAAARWWGCRRVRTGDLRILDASLTTPLLDLHASVAGMSSGMTDRVRPGRRVPSAL